MSAGDVTRREHDVHCWDNGFTCEWDLPHLSGADVARRADDAIGRVDDVTWGDNGRTRREAMHRCRGARRLGRAVGDTSIGNMPTRNEVQVTAMSRLFMFKYPNCEYRPGLRIGARIETGPSPRRPLVWINRAQPTLRGVGWRLGAAKELRLLFGQGGPSCCFTMRARAGFRRS